MTTGLEAGCVHAPPPVSLARTRSRHRMDHHVARATELDTGARRRRGRQSDRRRARSDLFADRASVAQ